MVSDVSLCWLNGYIHGMEHLAGAVEAYVADGAELDKALLMARIACLIFANDLAGNVRDRDVVVRCLLSEDAKNMSMEVSK